MINGEEGSDITNKELDYHLSGLGFCTRTVDHNAHEDEAPHLSMLREANSSTPDSCSRDYDQSSGTYDSKKIGSHWMNAFRNPLENLNGDNLINQPNGNKPERNVADNSIIMINDLPLKSIEKNFGHQSGNIIDSNDCVSKAKSVFKKIIIPI